MCKPTIIFLLIVALTALAFGWLSSTKVAEEICQSNGCATVSPEFLKRLEPLIKEAGKPLLLWIFDDRVNESTLSLPTTASYVLHRSVLPALHCILQ